MKFLPVSLLPFHVRHYSRKTPMRRDSQMLIRGLLAAILLAYAAPRELRADIIQASSDTAFSAGGAAIVRGQSFAADSSVEDLLFIGFRYEDSNTILPAPTVTIDLFEGLGFGGTLVDSEMVTVPTGLGSRWVDLDFTGVSLVAGNDYSFRLTKGAGAGGVNHSSSDLYAGGTRLDGNGDPLSGDLTFRVLGVPEPSSLVMAALGVLAVALIALRRRATNGQHRSIASDRGRDQQPTRA
jgi:hypothetical protein